ncbi:MAG: ABC transporter ATP-binding protein/permease [Candidatus Cloacimonetes bacterium]|nr:ABC transporter ATP-binding protein/permease [Candidatus Cloacimonadota bacterium]
MTNDIRAIDEMLASGVITIVQDVILVVAIVTLMLILNWQLALISMAILPIVIWVIAIYRSKTRVIYREVRKHLAQLNATLAEHIAGQKIIQLFNQYSHKRDEFSDINHHYFLTSMKQLRLFAFFRPIIHVSSQVAVAMIIWYGGGQILRNVITIGLLMAFTQYVHKLFEPINDFSEKFNVLQGALAGAERIFDLMDQTPDDYREELATKVKFEGEIEFENLWLAYNNEEWVLKDVSFKVRPGEKIALVGHTGSGKTSIVNLILGMYPYQKGKIRIDGKLLQNYALSDIRSNVGIVQQDVFIFSGDIHENIALNNSKLSREEVKQVATYVNADKFIQNLPHKYDEPVMERGATLSTGQRQLIAFARVLAYDPSIFILDEATSNIDTETEILIQDALEKIIKDRTSSSSPTGFPPSSMWIASWCCIKVRSWKKDRILTCWTRRGCIMISIDCNTLEPEMSKNRLTKNWKQFCM